MSSPLLNFYALREQPFGPSPDPRFIYGTSSHRRAAELLRFGVENQLGFSTLVAEPGLGKTTLLFELLESYQNLANAAFVFSTQGSGVELLRHILLELRVPDVEFETDTIRLHKCFTELVASRAKARPILIVVDESQNLSDEALEALRLLSDFETPGRKLIHIVLAGQTQLAEKLQRPVLQQLAQRIMTFASLERMTAQDTSGYILHRLSVAGCQARVFSPSALAEIAAESKGTPRLVNRICVNAMQAGYERGLSQIGAALIREVACNLDVGRELERASIAIPAVQKDVGHARATVRCAAAANGLSPLTPNRDPIGAKHFAPLHSPLPQTRAIREFAIPKAVKPEERLVHGAGARRKKMIPLFAGVASIVLAGGFALRTFLISEASRGNSSPDRGTQTKTTLNRGETDKGASSTAGPSSIAAKTRETRTDPERMTAAPGGATPKQRQTSSDVTDSTPGESSADEVTILPASNKTMSVVQAEKAEAFAVPPPLPERPEDVVGGERAVLSDALVALHPQSPTLATPTHQTRIGRAVRVVNPTYPELARDAGIRGDVQLMVRVSPKGDVQDIRVVRGNPLLAREAKRAVQQWRYQPSYVNGIAVPIDIPVTLRFQDPQALTDRSER